MCVFNLDIYLNIIQQIRSERYCLIRETTVHLHTILNTFYFVFFGQVDKSHKRSDQDISQLNALDTLTQPIQSLLLKYTLKIARGEGGLHFCYTKQR